MKNFLFIAHIPYIQSNFGSSVSLMPLLRKKKVDSEITPEEQNAEQPAIPEVAPSETIENVAQEEKEFSDAAPSEIPDASLESSPEGLSKDEVSVNLAGKDLEIDTTDSIAKDESDLADLKESVAAPSEEIPATEVPAPTEAEVAEVPAPAEAEVAEVPAPGRAEEAGERAPRK